MIDYHVHSNCSGDSTAPMLDVCRTAIKRGITEICFTEHVDFEPTDTCYQKFDYQHYLRCVERARETFTGQLVIRAGIEVDYQRKYHSLIGDFLAHKTFDYVLGAAHYVDGIILEDHEKYFPGKTAYDAYAPYFDNVLAVVETGWFDSLAHPDLCKRYGVRYFGRFDPEPHSDVLDRIARALIERGMAMEINTSGLRQSPRDLYPDIRILHRYRTLGGKNITVGSDSHRVPDAGAGIAEALSAAAVVGYDYVDTFVQRTRIRRSIQEMRMSASRGDIMDS